MAFQHVMPFNLNSELGNPFLQLLIDTENAGVTASDTIRIPLVGTADIIWGDGNVDVGASGTTDHTYTVAGQYVVKIANTADSIKFDNSNDDTKILEIQNFGTMAWTTMNGAFFGCANMTITATDLPDLSGITNMIQAWRECTSLTSFPLMDTSTVITFQGCFNGSTGLSVFPTLDLSSMTSGLNMFAGVTLSTTSWSDLLIATEANNSNNNVTWDGGSSLFNVAGGVARAALVANQFWTITDGGAE